MTVDENLLRREAGRARKPAARATRGSRCPRRAHSLRRRSGAGPHQPDAVRPGARTRRGIRGRALPPCAQGRSAADGVALRLPGLRRHRRELPVAHVRDRALLLSDVLVQPRRRSDRLRRDHVQRLEGRPQVVVPRSVVAEPRGVLPRIPLHGKRIHGRRHTDTRASPPRTGGGGFPGAARDEIVRVRGDARLSVLHERTGADGDRRARLTRCSTSPSSTRDPRAKSFEGEIAAGPLSFEFTNGTDAPVRAPRRQPRGRLRLGDGAVPVRGPGALEPDVSRPVRVGDDRRGRGTRGAAPHASLHRHPGVDGDVRARGRHEGVRPRAPSLRLPARVDLTELRCAREDDR